MCVSNCVLHDEMVDDDGCSVLTHGLAYFFLVLLCRHELDVKLAAVTEENKKSTWRAEDTQRQMQQRYECNDMKSARQCCVCVCVCVCVCGCECNYPLLLVCDDKAGQGAAVR